MVEGTMDVLGILPGIASTLTWGCTALSVALREVSCMALAAKARFSGNLQAHHYSWLNPPRISTEQSAHPPTFLLHGTFGDPCDWSAFIETVSKGSQEPGPIYLLKFEGVEDGARVLRDKLADVLSQYRAEGKQTIQPRIIGHSLGGIVATREVFCREMPDGVRVTDVVVCASRLGLVRSVWKDGPAFLYSDVELAINEIQKSSQRAQVNLHHLQASHDWLVPLHARCPFGVSKIVPNTSHLSILYAKETHQALLELILPAGRTHFWSGG